MAKVEGVKAPRDVATQEVSSAWRQSVHRPKLLFALALVAVALSLVGGFLPSSKERATYSWPPSELLAADPDRVWYSPLLLIRRTPASVGVDVPCRTTPLPGADRPLLVLSTTRYPETSAGLTIERRGEQLAFSIGRTQFANALIPSSPAAECALRLDIHGSDWTLRAPSGAIRSGTLETPPIVTGLFSGIDLRGGPRPAVAVVTAPFATHPTIVQQAAWILAALLGLAVLLSASSFLAARSVRPRARRLGARIVGSLRLVDGFVAAALLTWWFVGPAYYDDGWVKARQTNYDVSGGFSNYYSSFGVDLPLDVWLEWAQHWIIGKFDNLLLLRLPTLVAIAITWLVCRWIFARVTVGARPGQAGLWALGLAFALHTLAWDMTLRPEPFVGLLAVFSLACALRFVERPRPAPLAMGAVIVPLALTAHPAGLVALAPFLIVSPRILRWSRASDWLVPAAIAASAIALLLILVSVGSDLPQRLEDARLVRTSGDAVASWRDELNRYQLTTTGSSTLRRGAVALMVLAVLAYLLRRSRARRPLLDLPAASLGLALVLAIATPSKWIWHFGVFAGFAAIAVASELTRLREGRSNRWSLTPLIATGAMAMVVGWGWWPRIAWGDFDLRTLDWTPALEDRITLVRLGLLVLGIPLLLSLAYAFVRHGRARLAMAYWGFLAWIVPLCVLPMILFSVGMLSVDAVRTPGWTLARQNVESLAGNAGCALADDTVVADPVTTEPLRALPSTRPAVGSWVPSPPLAGLERFSTLADGTPTVITPWYPAPDGRRVGLFVTGTSGVLEAHWRSPATGGKQAVSSGPVTVPPVQTESSTTLAWTFVPQGRLPPRPPDANAVRFVLHSPGVPPSSAAVTGAVSYRTTELTRLVASGSARPLVWPNLLLYLPCTDLPRLQNGNVEVPTLVVARSGLWPVEFTTSPFNAILDLYTLRDLGVADSEIEPVGLLVAWVDMSNPGAAVAGRPMRTN